MVALDFVITRKSSPEADATLTRQIATFGPRLVIVKRVDGGGPGRFTFRESIDAISDAAESAPSARYVSFLGFSWTTPSRIEVSGKSEPTLAARLAGVPNLAGGEFPIDYSYNIDAIPTFHSSKLNDPNVRAQLAGRKVVVGVIDGSVRYTANIPGRYGIPSSYVTILAAETFIGGVPATVSKIAPLALALTLLIWSALVESRQRRWLRYALSTATVIASIALTLRANLLVPYGPVVAALVIYAGLRIYSRTKRRAQLQDDRSGLPTFRAIERENIDCRSHGVVVARVHKFADSLSALPDEFHAQYIRSVGARLKAADNGQKLYFGGDGFFAWVMPADSDEIVRDHLMGIRAICQGVKVGPYDLDLSVTFGVDATPDASTWRKLAAAKTASLKSNEAERPVVFHEPTAEQEHLWTLSIQKRIDVALTNKQIHPVFQPQFRAKDLKMIGLEALVRWRDPVRGPIATDWLIEQCEKAGRMSRLTNYMLVESMRQAKSLCESHDLRLSVNISAVSLQDEVLTDHITFALQTTGFDPRKLTLELTETWHVSDIDHAAEVMTQIASLGVRWALDDFGVKTATLEALMRLPVEELKIDRSVAGSVCDLRKGRRIVRSICKLGAELGIEVVAEGVEERGELETLIDVGCPSVQGYLLAKPMSVSAVRGFLQKTAGDATG